VDADVAEAVLALVADPAPLAAALERTTTTFIHGDLRDDNLGFAGDRVVLLDWDNAARTSPAVELGWFLAQDAWRIDATRDELVADFLAAEDDLVDEGALDLGLLCGILQAGWIMGHSAVVHPDPAERAWGRAELDWWVPRVRTALERTWAPA
jgi:aminoglycoside phosphotransferase (APT) family kinase protein